ncbi:unnamed protein product [Schistosoma turkestanicum]|nr:unnamed protein product [Schistosoma turkestanicum]
MISDDKLECTEENSKPECLDSHNFDDPSLPLSLDDGEKLKPSDALKFESGTDESSSFTELIESLRTKCKTYEVSVRIISFCDTENDLFLV